MTPELSPTDRERLEAERGRAARRIAADRGRIHAKLAAEHERVAARRSQEAEQELLASPEYAAAHRQAYGPRTVTGPDGVEVALAVTPSGFARFRRPPSGGSGSDSGYSDEYTLIFFVTLGVLYLAGRLITSLVTPTGFTLRIQAEGLERRYRRHRVRDEDAAAVLLTAAAGAAERDGLDGLRRWTAARRGM